MVDSRRFQRGEIGASLPTEALRTYEDPHVIEAAWRRLEARRHARGGVPWSAFVAAAAVLLGVGFGAGVLATRHDTNAPSDKRAAGERPSDWRAPAGEAPAAVDAKAAAVEPEKEERAVLPRRRISPNVVDEAESLSGELAVEVSPSAPAWLEMADRGEYRPAFDAALRGGEFEESAISSSTPEELMALADVARFAGRTGLAIRVLREVTVRFESDANAPIAAMVLGNLLSQAGDTEGASRAYALNRRLSPSGDFAEDALFREFDMSIAARDTERAQQLLRQYESLFSGGRHASEMRAEFERLVAQSANEARDLEKPAPPATDAASVFEIEGSAGPDGAPSAP